MRRSPSEQEVRRRHEAIRAAMGAAGVDAVVVAGSEYTGFEGALRYVSGFRIVHRYAYAVLTADGAGGEAVCVFPTEARYVGEHGDTFVPEQVFDDHPGAWIAEHLAARGVRRVGVHGLDYVMCVRDYTALSSRLDVVPFDDELDLARAVKSQEELELVAETVAINEAGFWALHAAYAPGRTQAELLAEAEATFTRAGTGRLTMDMVLWGEGGSATPEFRIPEHDRPVRPDDLLLYSLEVAGPGGYWVEFARPLSQGGLSTTTELLLEAYADYFDLVPKALRAGQSAHDAHKAVSAPFHERGLRLGHVTGHSIGMTMIEHPRIGDGVDVELREDMVVSMHPHAISPDGTACMYMQDTWRIAPGEAELLSPIEAKVYDGSERPPGREATPGGVGAIPGAARPTGRGVASS